MKPLVAAATSAWLATALPDWRRFRRAHDDPRAAQARVKAEILRVTEGTAFARAHPRFDDLAPGTYDDRAPWIERAAAGERDVLSREAITLFEPTSGTTTGRKLIPSTPLQRAQFNRGVHAWVVDLYRRRPSLVGGPAYWSISPVVRQERTAGGIPIGFEEDSAYFGRVGKRLVDTAMAVPGEVRHIGDVEAFRRATLLFLLACHELRLVSVWNPTFFTVLLEELERSGEGLARELHDGVSIAGRTLRRRRIDLACPWPRLRLLSCWTDGHAISQVAELQARLPGVELQPKGLLATEGIVSIPFGAERVLAVTSHLLELERDDGRLVGAADLREGDVGSVVLSTGNGLLRYRLRDEIEVTGFCARTPTIRFLGKADKVSDLCGEKLAEAFVTNVLHELGVTGFSLLAPDGRGYTLYAEAPPEPEALQARLAANVHYQWAVEVGQLRPVRTFRVTGDPRAAYQRTLASRGQRLGDIKPAALDREDGWSARFEGGYTAGGSGVDAGRSPKPSASLKTP